MPTKAKSIRQRRTLRRKVRLVVTNKTYANLSKQSIKRLPARERSQVDVQVFRSFADVSLAKEKPEETTLFLSRLADLPSSRVKLAVLRHAKHVLVLEGLPIEAMPARLTQLDIRSPERLHLAAERGTARLVDLVYRLLSGITDGKGNNPIVDAWIEGEQLVLFTSSFERMTVPLEKLANVIGTNPEEVGEFEIDEDGRFLYWPHADAHYGWEQFRQLIDPTAAVESKQRSDAFNRKYGSAIKLLREEKGLKQSDVQGVTERHLRRVEHGEQAASKAVLQSLADAMGLSLGDYLKQLGARLHKLR